MLHPMFHTAPVLFQWLTFVIVAFCKKSHVWGFHNFDRLQRLQKQQNVLLVLVITAKQTIQSLILPFINSENFLRTFEQEKKSLIVHHLSFVFLRVQYSSVLIRMPKKEHQVKVYWNTRVIRMRHWFVRIYRTMTCSYRSIKVMRNKAVHTHTRTKKIEAISLKKNYLSCLSNITSQCVFCIFRFIIIDFVSIVMFRIQWNSYRNDTSRLTCREERATKKPTTIRNGLLSFGFFLFFSLRFFLLLSENERFSL